MEIKLFGKTVLSIGKEEIPEKEPLPPSEEQRHGPVGGHAGISYTKSYDGEKNLGEIGPVVDYKLSYEVLRLRSWQVYLDSDLAQTIIKKYIDWIIDKGLRANANPSKLVLESEGIDLDAEKFNNLVEARFNVWARSKSSTMSGMKSFNQQSKIAFKNASVGGDVLVIQRFIDNTVKIELVDGSHLSNPMGIPLNADGRRIRNGIELDENGKHVAFHVRVPIKNGISFKWERIPAVSESTGFVTAFLVYGNEFRLNSYRGFPIIATSLETLSKIDRYKEAAVGSAEERQKIAYFVKHQMGSKGDSILGDQLATALGRTDEDDGLPRDQAGLDLAKDVAATTNKMTYNMPIGAEMQQLVSNNEMFFKEFYGTNADIVCGAVGIPPDVAFSIYNNSFSASRAATKDWDHTIQVRRDDFQTQFYQPIYNFWLFTQVLQGKIPAKGYLKAVTDKNMMIKGAYEMVNFTGPLFPHIDPLKEVKAERAKLGSLGEHLPLTTQEDATHNLNSGDSESNTLQFSEEIKKADDLDLEAPDNSANTIDSAVVAKVKGLIESEESESED